MTENKLNKSYYCEGEERIQRGQTDPVVVRKPDYWCREERSFKALGRRFAITKEGNEGTT